MNTLTRSELSREVSAPVSDDDYGVHPTRRAYPETSTPPDAYSPELRWRGSVMRFISQLEEENERLRARVKELEAR